VPQGIQPVEPVRSGADEDHLPRVTPKWKSVACRDQGIAWPQRPQWKALVSQGGPSGGAANAMKELPLSRGYQLLEPGPVVLFTTTRKDRANVLAMDY
jgi:hypothetical protein